MKNLTSAIAILAILFTSTFINAQEKPTQDQVDQMEQILNAYMNNDTKLPEQYKFDIAYKMKVSDDEGEMEMVWMIDQSGDTFGLGGMNGKAAPGGEFHYMVMDNKNGVMVTYMEIEGVKRGMKMPNFKNMGAKIAREELQDATESYEAGDMKIKETGNHPVILGQKCTEYRIEDEDEKEYSIISISGDAANNWMDTYRNMAGMSGMPTYPGHPMLNKGMMMRTRVYKKKNDKLISDMEVIDIDKNPAAIINAEWNFSGGF